MDGDCREEGYDKMSERDRSGGPFVTPTFQAVLNFNLLGIMESFNSNSPVQTYMRIRTLIFSLKQEHQKEFLENDLTHIDGLISRVLEVESVDLYQTRWRHAKAVRSILRANLPGLFQKVMALLHREGYLEKQPVTPKKPSRERLSWRR